jgi:hypothetical protein
VVPLASRAKPGESIARAYGFNRAAAQSSSFAPAGDTTTIVIVIVMTEIVAAGGNPTPTPRGPREGIGTAAAGNAAEHAFIKNLASAAAFSACAGASSVNPWVTTETKSPQFGFSVTPALRSTTIAISEEPAPLRDTIDRTCMTGESDKNPATPGTTGYLLFALTDQLKTPCLP